MARPCKCQKPIYPVYAPPEFINARAIASLTAVRVSVKNTEANKNIVLIGPNPQRVAIGFTHPSGALVNVSLMPLAGAFTGEGWILAPSGVNWFDLNTYSGIVTGEWSGFSNGVTPVTMIEVYLPQG